MTPAEVLLAINSGLNLVDALLPQLQQHKLSGDITPEQQQAVLDRYAALREKANEMFSGPEWQTE